LGWRAKKARRVMPWWRERGGDDWDEIWDLALALGGVCSLICS
jgi:hypothetical protein